jgi:hypothetical protein
MVNFLEKISGHTLLEMGVSEGQRWSARGACQDGPGGLAGEIRSSGREIQGTPPPRPWEPNQPKQTKAAGGFRQFRNRAITMSVV